MLPLHLVTAMMKQYEVIITVNLCFCKKNPKRAAGASVVEREEKGFEVALKR